MNLELKNRNHNKPWTKSYCLMLFSNLFIYMGFYMLVPTLPAYAKQTGGSNLEARRGEGMGYYSLSMIVSMSLAPIAAIAIMNLSSFKYISIISLTLVLIGALLVKYVAIHPGNSKHHKSKKSFSFFNLFEKKALLPSFLCFLLTIFYGLGYGAVQPSLQVWAVNRSPEYLKGAANGTFLSSMDLAFTLGSIALSFVAERNSYAFMYKFSALFILILIAVYALYLIMNLKQEAEYDIDEEVS